jgi:hypothetical protein
VSKRVSNQTVPFFPQVEFISVFQNEWALFMKKNYFSLKDDTQLLSAGSPKHILANYDKHHKQYYVLY